MLHLECGNAKIVGALIWTLPTKFTCPGATECCNSICYAKFQEVYYKNNVLPHRHAMYQHAIQSNFSDLMIETLKRRRYRYVRIHESGDFFSQVYLDAWVRVIEALPQFTFWCYTKSWMLDFSNMLSLPNVYLRYSIDATTKSYPTQKMPRAIVSTVQPKNTITCPSVSKKHTLKCIRDCKLCVETNKNIHFLPHGVYKNRIKQYERDSDA